MATPKVYNQVAIGTDSFQSVNLVELLIIDSSINKPLDTTL
ncbi:MAG: hypothetical protein SGI83_18460 [Bacteroidota bacterium]|nr:hypothetical protein [Bacteroidota bacterium]